MDFEHYLYQHIRKDLGNIFYVGIGTKSKKNKKEYSRAYSKHSRNDFWHNIANKTEYEVEILMESDDYETVKKLEIALVAQYGRRDLGKGELVNLTDGGDGSLGYKPTKETCQKLSEAGKGRIHSDKTKRKSSESHKAKFLCEDYKLEFLNRIPSGDTHPYAKIIIGSQTGVYYGTIIEAAKTYNLTANQLSSMLLGKSVNITDLTYAESKNESNYLSIPEIKIRRKKPIIDEIDKKTKQDKRSKLIVDKYTGIFFYSIKEAAEAYNIKDTALANMLKGVCINRSSLVYAESENDIDNYIHIPFRPIRVWLPPSNETKQRMSRTKKERHTREKHPSIKAVINTETGELYICAKDITEKFGYVYSSFCGKLNPNNNRKNNTPFEYYDPEKHAHLLKQ